jgi:hypothetical protein
MFSKFLTKHFTGILNSVEFFHFAMSDEKNQINHVSNMVYFECESSIRFKCFWFFIIQKNPIKLVLITQIRSVWFLCVKERKMWGKNEKLFIFIIYERFSDNAQNDAKWVKVLRFFCLLFFQVLHTMNW